MSATTRSGMPTVIAIEGLCFAGKTTLARALGSRFGAGVVAEYADLAPLPGFPPGSALAARTALIGFMAIEAARARTARGLGRPVVLYDRRRSSTQSCPRTCSSPANGTASPPPHTP